MRIIWTGKGMDACDAALLVILAREGGKNRAFERLDRMSGGALGAQSAEESFKGQDGRMLEWRGPMLDLPPMIEARHR